MFLPQPTCRLSLYLDAMEQKIFLIKFLHLLTVVCRTAKMKKGNISFLNNCLLITSPDCKLLERGIGS